jgi:hypothetical protein
MWKKHVSDWNVYIDFMFEYNDWVYHNVIWNNEVAWKELKKNACVSESWWILFQNVMFNCEKEEEGEEKDDGSWGWNKNECKQ